GPRDRRYVAAVIASVIAVILGFCAAAAGTIVGVLPPGLVPAIAGLALLTSLIDALRKTALSDLPLRSCFALIITASGMAVLGLGAAFWALIGGMAISVTLELPALRAFWGVSEGASLQTGSAAA